MSDDVAPSTSDLHFLTITEAASLIERRQLSPVALTRAFLDRIAAIDPQLNAYLLVTADEALDQARIAEAEIMAGNYRGPTLCCTAIELAAACQLVEASTDPDGGWHTEARHPVQHVASDFCFDLSFLCRHWQVPRGVVRSACSCCFTCGH